MARPKKDQKLKKSSKIDLRVTEDFKKELQEMAEFKGLSVSSLIILWAKERLRSEKAD